MNRQFLRTAAGFGTISALALVMVACGGSSSSAPATPTNAAPSTPVIVGPTTAITLHPAFYNLSAVDPEGDPITFIVNGTAISGNTYQLNPTVAGPATLSVQARDNKSPAATSGTASLTVAVAANRAPQFLSQSVGQLTGTNNNIAWNTFQVTAQDPDTDDVNYSVTGTPTFVDNAGGTTGISGAIAINTATGLVNFTGVVPSGKTSVTATFTVQAVDRLPGTTTVLGATATQVVTLTYFNGNQAPLILTTSLPTLPTNHYIPVNQGASGFPVTASDPNNDAITWSMTSSVPGVILKAGTTTGTTTEIVTGAGFVPLTSTGTPISVTLRALDARGLDNFKTFTITVVGDAKPTLNSSPYTETVSGVKFFDKSQVKDQISSRARFYNGADFATPSAGSNFTYDGGTYWIDTYYSSHGYAAGEITRNTDPLATDFGWSSPFLGGTDVAVAGWSARTLFRDSEGDGINYTVDPRSVYVSSPAQPVGQPFTLTSTGGPANVWPILAGHTPIGGTFEGEGEFPTIDSADGTMTWLPVLTEDIDNYTGIDNLGLGVFANPSIWSYTVMGFEKIWNPLTSTFIILNDPSQAGRIDYSIKVQPNNRPYIGPLLTIPGATTAVPGAFVNMVVNPTTTLLIGGGPSAAPNYYGRPSIQEPESRRYDVAAGTNVEFVSGGFNYTTPNTAKPAIWRWLFARAGGDPTTPGLVFGSGGRVDAELYDPDTTANPGSGHQDAVTAAMGTPTVPAADTTGNVPAITNASATFYNPWLTSGNAGKFEVSWGPNRIQYLIARVTASAAYSFPVEVVDQYERYQERDLGINPIFGTVRFTNARTRNILDSSSAGSGFRRGGSFSGGNYPGDPIVAPASENPFTFSYLPFPNDFDGGSTEDNFDSFLFNGSGPASGMQANSGLYTAASWITLNAVEAPVTGYHTGNPLNNETGTFNLPAYASVLEGSSSSSSREDVKQYNYTFTNGTNPTNPTPVNDYAIGSWANHEVRAQVIPSNSPYIFNFSQNSQGANTGGGLSHGTSEPASGYRRGTTNESATWAREIHGSSTMIPRWGRNGYWHTTNPEAHGWVYNLYQGEIDMQNAAAGRSVSTGSTTGNTTLRWTYSWPTQVTNSNFGGLNLTNVNKWQLGDVMQISTPNMGTQGRIFFVGDGATNDPLADEVNTWGFLGMSGTLPVDVVFNPNGPDSVNVFGGGVADDFGFLSATNTPFHVASDSLWMGANYAGAPLINQFNLPNRTSFSPGASASQLPFDGEWVSRGYMRTSLTVENFGDFGSAMSWAGGLGRSAGLINSSASEEVYFLWMRQDATRKTAWGTWDASKMTGGSSTYTVTGGQTNVPSFSMANGVNNSTLPASFASDAQISMATGNLPGQNHGSNLNIGTDASLTSAVGAKLWSRSQWGLLAPTIGYQPRGSNNVRLVNPDYDSTNAATWNNQNGSFLTTIAANVSRDGGVRDSAIVYAVRYRNNEKSPAGTELGLAGIEPSSPMLAQYYNLQEGSDIGLRSSTVSSTSMVDITSFPAAFNLYSPFAGNSAWAHVMEYKVNFLVGMRYPNALRSVLTNTIWKVPATVANVFPLGAAVTDPSCTNPGNIVNPANPIVRSIEFLRVSDYDSNTWPGDINSTLDLVTSNPDDDTHGQGVDPLNPGAVNLTGNRFLESLSNLRVTWQASINNQVLPSGYIVEIFRLTGNATTTNRPELLGTVRRGHIGSRDAIQQLFLPSMHSFSGIRGGDIDAAAVYFFKVRTVWHKGINFEKQPTKQSIPMAYADYVSAPFVTHQ